MASSEGIDVKHSDEFQSLLDNTLPNSIQHLNGNRIYEQKLKDNLSFSIQHLIRNQSFYSSHRNSSGGLDFRFPSDPYFLIITHKSLLHEQGKHAFNTSVAECKLQSNIEEKPLEECFNETTYYENNVKYVDIDEYDKKNINHKLLKLESFHLFKENLDDFTCSICYDLFTWPVTLQCKHSFCQDCITKVKNNSCPLCRKIYYDAELWCINFDIASQIDDLTLTNCQHCTYNHLLKKSCKLYCYVCLTDTTDETKYNHIYNECCGQGVIKYCFTCQHHVIKSEYERHKKICYDSYFHVNFLKLSLHDDNDVKMDIIIDKQMLYENVKHLLKKNGYPRIYFLQNKISHIKRKKDYRTILPYIPNRRHTEGGLRSREMDRSAIVTDSMSTFLRGYKLKHSAITTDSMFTFLQDYTLKHKRSFV